MAVQQNFVCAIESNSRRFGAKTALLCGEDKLSWSELDAFAAGFARDLATQGVVAGDRVAMLLPNGVEFVVAFLAILKLGATPAPLNPLVKEEEVAAFKADLRPKLSIDRVVMSQRSCQTMDDVNAPSLILYTSGSTGRPKGAVFSHDALTFANHSWAQPVMGLTPDDRVLVAVPLAHSLGLNGGLLAPLLSGATVVVLERFTPEAVFEAVVEAFQPEIELALARPADFKSALQERLARRGTIVTYEIVSEEGPPHERTFEVVAVVDGEPLAHGVGRSKKEAEQAAAEAALEAF